MNKMQARICAARFLVAASEKRERGMVCLPESVAQTIVMLLDEALDESEGGEENEK